MTGENFALLLGEVSNEVDEVDPEEETPDLESSFKEVCFLRAELMVSTIFCLGM